MFSVNEKRFRPVYDDLRHYSILEKLKGKYLTFGSITKGWIRKQQI